MAVEFDGEDWYEYGDGYPVESKTSPRPGNSTLAGILDKVISAGTTLGSQYLQYGGKRGSARDLAEERDYYNRVNGSGPNQPRTLSQQVQSSGGLIALIAVAVIGLLVFLRRS